MFLGILILQSDGKGEVKEWNYKSKEVKPIKEFTNRLEIQKVFLKDDAILYVVGGNLWKEGTFNFEKKEKATNDSIIKKEVIKLQNRLGSRKEI